MKIFVRLSALSLLLALFSVDLRAQDLPKPADPATLEKLRASADQGEPVAMRELAKQIWLKSGHPPPLEIRTLLEKADQAGDPEAASMVGNLYLNGFAGLPRDPEMSRRYWEKAATLSFPNAFASLGTYYSKLKGGEPDYARAMAYYKQGEPLGCRACTNQIGNMYMNGQGVEKDYDLAFDYYRRAGVQGDPEARMSLGMMYVQGMGRPINLIEGYAWMLAGVDYAAISPHTAGTIRCC
jgi:TPR repeat protein